MKRIIIEEPTPIYDEKGNIKYYQDDEYIYIPHKSKKQEWSEEGENKIESIKGLITTGKFADTNTIRTIWKLLDSLHPSWKPSEEQIKAIESCFCEFGEGCPDEDGLRSLYNDLKKLM